MQQSMQTLQRSGLIPPGTMPNPYGISGNANPFMNPYGLNNNIMGGGGALGGLDFNSLLLPGGAGSFGINNMPPPAAAVPPQDPAVQYASQLQQLQDMGFSDATANLQALVHTRGNVNAAVERLLGGP